MAFSICIGWACPSIVSDAQFSSPDRLMGASYVDQNLLTISCTTPLTVFNKCKSLAPIDVDVDTLAFHSLPVNLNYQG